MSGPGAAATPRSAGDAGPPAKDGTTVGAALRAAREAAGLSVEQVSATTRIRAAVVRDLEADRLSSSGGAVYARGHVRALARAVGLDPAPLVEQLDRATGTAPAPVGAVTPVPAPVPRTGALAVPRAAPPERRGPHWLVAAVVAGVVLIAIVVVGPTGGRDEPAETVRLVTGPAASESVSPPPPPVEQPPTAAPAPARAELAVRVAGGTSWMSVRSPTETVFEGEVGDGFAEVFRHPEQLRVVVGNAGVVRLVCAGTDAGPLGRPGAVRRLTCGVDGLAPS